MEILKLKCYRPSYGDDGIGVMTTPFTLGDLQDREQFDFTDGTYASWDEFGLEHKDTIKLLFTGKYDKNNTPIFDGDIIEFDKDEWGGDNNIHIVRWDDDNAGWCFGGGSVSDMHWRKVIGNIYENKELLK